MIPEIPEPMMTTRRGRASSMERSSTIHLSSVGRDSAALSLLPLKKRERRPIFEEIIRWKLSNRMEVPESGRFVCKRSKYKHERACEVSRHSNTSPRTPPGLNNHSTLSPTKFSSRKLSTTPLHYRIPIPDRISVRLAFLALQIPPFVRGGKPVSIVGYRLSHIFAVSRLTSQ